MYIEETTFQPKRGKKYHAILLRQSYREDGKVKKRTIANLSHCSPEEIGAIKLAFKHKRDLTSLRSFNDSVTCTQGLSVGAVCTVFETAKKLGIVKALGNNREGQLALWQVIARVIDQGSRLSAVRLAKAHAIASVIDLKEGFNEDALYRNLHWISDHQEKVEEKLFHEPSKKSTKLFLYDVTSSYLEGSNNALAAWGYNRDKKKGKQQIVIGLLCDEEGTPVSTEVFKGNTQDIKTFASQVRKVKERFGCKEVVMVGDRGMIKSAQLEDLHDHGLHYITAITKKQIQTLINKDIFQLDLFSKHLCEVEYEGVRYILKRNPIRAEEIAISRSNKKESVQALLIERNEYLRMHPKAQIESALKKLRTKINQLKINSWLSVKEVGRKIELVINEEELKDVSKLDGCYVLRTDLKKDIADTETIHDRYKDLSLVESAFRTCKTDLEVRPVYVQTAKSTYGHVFVVMLAYMIMRELDRKWSSIDMKVTEGLMSLSTLTMLDIDVKGEGVFQQIPEPTILNERLLKLAGIELPKILPFNGARVSTKKSIARRT